MNNPMKPEEILVKVCKVPLKTIHYGYAVTSTECLEAMQIFAKQQAWEAWKEQYNPEFLKHADNLEALKKSFESWWKKQIE